MQFNIQPSVGEFRYIQGGALLVSGQPTIILGPTRVDRFFNRAFQIFNYGTGETITANVQVSLDQHGWEAHLVGSRAVELTCVACGFKIRQPVRNAILPRCPRCWRRWKRRR